MGAKTLPGQNVCSLDILYSEKKKMYIQDRQSVLPPLDYFISHLSVGALEQ